MRFISRIRDEDILGVTNHEVRWPVSDAMAKDFQINSWQEIFRLLGGRASKHLVHSTGLLRYPDAIRPHFKVG